MRCTRRGDSGGGPARRQALDAYRGGLPEFPGISAFSGIAKIELSPKMVSYPWDLVNFNGGEIVSDFGLLAPDRGQRKRGMIYDGAHLINPENIVVGEGSRVKPGVVLDAETGPIWIGNNVTVFPNAVIEGPAFVGIDPSSRSVRRYTKTQASVPCARLAARWRGL